MHYNRITLTTTYYESTVKAFWIITFVSLTAIGAQIEIPVYPVPFTLQTFFVLLAGAFLGRGGGFICMMLYLISGVIGLPVFSGGTFGIVKILGPTGGYLLSFPIAAYVVGFLLSIRKEYWWILTSMLLGMLIIFIFGIVHLNAFYLHNWKNSIYSGFLIFTYWDILKIIASATIAHYYFKKISHN